LTGKYNAGIPSGTRATLEGYEWLRKRFEGPEAEEKLKKVAQLANLAKDLGCTTAQLALAWCLKNPNVSTVITGASRKEQVTDNMQSLSVVEKLTPAVMDAIEEILQNKPRPEEDYR
jgi:aryl-alcohol dehydrogenase-like predicted oxidoreductase